MKFLKWLLGRKKKEAQRNTEPTNHVLHIDWNAMRSDRNYAQMVNRTIRKLP